MSDPLNDNDKTQLVSDLDQPQHFEEGNPELNTPTLPSFERWLIEYRKCLGQLVHNKPKNTKDG
jgi:hypothetical protein